MKIATFIQQNCIRMSAEQVDNNPSMTDMGPGATHWRCVFRNKGRTMTVHFSQGSAHTSEPTAAKVLDCLAMDAMLHDEPFESWAQSLGFDEDSRKAEKTYKACQRQTQSLKRFLGDTFEDLLFQVDRL